MGDINLKIDVDGTALNKDLHSLRDLLIQIRDANNDLTKDLKTGMDSAAQSESKYSKELAHSLNALEEQKKVIAEMKKQLDLYENSKDKAFSGKEEEAYRKKIKELEDELKKVKTSMNDAGDAGKKSFKKVSDEVDSTEKKTSKLTNTIKTGAKALAAFFALDTIIRFGRALFDITAKFGAFEAVLTNALGSRSAARQGMADILLFAAKTPFQVDQITESYIKLVNRGFVPTLKELRQIGDLAASQGKSLDLLVEAILDAQTGEFERLKEFGIKASAANDKVTISFKGQTQTIEKNEVAIRTAILSLGDLRGVSGGMASVSTELTGKMSNFRDIMSQIWGGIGAKNSGIMHNAVDLITSFASKVKEYFEIGTEIKIRSEQSEVNALAVAVLGASDNQALRNNNIQILISKYPEFFRGLDREKVTNEEIATRLLVVNKQYERRIELAQKQAIATKAEEQFGKVLNENANAVGSIIKLAQKYNIEIQDIDFTKASDVFKLGDELAKRITDDNAANQTFFGKIKQLINGEIGSVSELNKAIDQIVNSTDAATEANKAFEQAMGAVNKEQEEANKINEEAVKVLQAKNAQIILDRKNNKISAEDAAKQMAANSAEIERLKSGLVDLATLFEKVDGGKTTATETQAQVNAAIARVKKIAELETQLANAKLNLLTDGVAKEKEIEKARYDNAVRQLNAELFEIEKKYGKQSKEYQILNETLETENRGHFAKMIVIDRKYNEEREKLYKEAQKSIDEVNKSSRDNELNANSEKFLKQIKELDKGAPSLFPSGNLTTALSQRQLKEISDYLTIRQGLVDASRATEQAINDRYDTIALEQEQALAMQSIDALKIAGANESKLTELKEALKYKVTEEYARKRLDLLLKQAGSEATITQDQIDNYQKYLLDSIKAGKTPTDLLTFLNVDLSKIPEDKKQEVKAGIEKLVDDILTAKNEAVKNGKSKRYGSFSSLIGDLFSLSESETAVIMDSYQKLEQAITAGIQKNIELKQEEIDLLSTQIDDLESELDRELQLREKGYANNVEGKRKELEALRAQRNKELEDQKRYQQQMHKIETANQAASLATSIANMIKTVSQVFESLSEQFGWVGAIAAIAEAGVVIAGFMQLKNSLQSGTKLSKGGKAGGDYHADGGNKYISIDGNDTNILEIEKDEWVINRKSSKKHDRLLSAINNDELSDMNYNDLMNLITPNDVKFNLNTPKIIAKKGNDAKNVTINVSTPASDNSDALQNIAKNTQELLEIEKERGIVTELPDRVIIKNGNSTKIIKKNG